MAIKETFKNLMMFCMGQYSCKKVADLSYNYSEGNLNPAQQQRYQKHLKLCRKCLRFIGSYKAVSKFGTRLDKECLSPEQKEKIFEVLP